MVSTHEAVKSDLAPVASEVHSVVEIFTVWNLLTDFIFERFQKFHWLCEKFFRIKFFAIVDGEEVPEFAR